ncbi:MAG: trypsin-like peptidase domain-containing protein [Candidatus Tagabacteria bacterium]
MDNLTKTQFVFLVILVSFVTSLVTGIVTVTLVNQAPPLMTQTISRVIEKVAPGFSNPPENQLAATATGNQQDLVVQAVQNVSSAVVSIIATKDLPVFEQYYVNPFGQDEFFKQFVPPELLPQLEIPQYRQKGTEKKQISAGTGFFISSDGLVATNKHVVEDKAADYQIITNDGKKLSAKVLALDPFQDVAILKVEDGGSAGHNFVPLGDSDNLKVGQTVIAIGNALGEFQNTVSVGVISGLHRSVIAGGTLGGGEEILQELIQTDAAINPGNSGGPLLDLNGKAIGINTAMALGAENVGFALPISLVKRDLADIKETGKIQYAYLGVRYVLINAQMKEEKKLSVDYGALISKGSNGETAIMSSSPAEKMGLKEGDIILEFNGTKIAQNNTLSSVINRYRPGDKIALKILRGDNELNLQGTLESRPENLQ